MNRLLLLSNFKIINPVIRNKNISEDNLDDAIEEIKKARISMMEMGVDKVHLFCRGPVALIAMVGAELANRFQQIVVYQRNETTGYTNWGLLKR